VLGYDEILRAPLAVPKPTLPRETANAGKINGGREMGRKWDAKRGRAKGARQEEESEEENEEEEEEKILERCSVLLEVGMRGTSEAPVVRVQQHRLLTRQVVAIAMAMLVLVIVIVIVIVIALTLLRGAPLSL
jgi:hypothetical protein